MRRFDSCGGHGGNNMKPSVGRIVHFTPAEGQYCAAIITAVYTDARDEVNLFVITSDTTYFVWAAVSDGVAGSREAVGCWCWPARV